MQRDQSIPFSRCWRAVNSAMASSGGHGRVLGPDRHMARHGWTGGDAGCEEGGFP